ncbi:hypothetical protein MHU86_16196 [Fragilaria crotonensis]|nr:hypothetical protein MHU86_16196 [Fragilaria crotonensis]
MGHASGQVRTTYQDQWGRWVSHKLQGREGRVITIISAYQVVTDSPGKGLTTSASQQRSLLIQAQDNITAPRAAFRRDLCSCLQQCRENNEEILLLGDFNESIGMDPDAMQKILDDNNLADIMKRKHGGPLPPTYARGHKCLDYAFATPNIINSVTKAGYEAFNAKYSTDHRAYYVDFNTDQLFGTQIQPLAKFEPRVLKSNNLKQVTAYIRAKHKHLEEHNIFERIRRLEIPRNRHQLAERIDKDVVAASLSAEKSIPRFDKPQWSVGLAQARKNQVLEKWLSAKRTSIRNHEVITQTWCEIGLSLDDLLTTTRQCTQMLREAKGEVKGIVQESYQRRDRERRNIIETLEASNGKADANEAKRLRCLQKGEALRNLFDKLRRLRLTAAKTGVTRLEIPVQQGDDILQGEVWQQIDIPSEILHHLRERNKRHFGQAHGTPFTVPPLSEELGFTGQQPAAEAILKGEYSNNDLDDNVSLLLQYLKQTERIAAMPISPTITEDEFRGKLQAWRETTTTSPSGLHLGHYKALFAKHSFSHIPEEEDKEHKRQREELDQMQAELADIHLRLINYALQRGYSYSRWHKVANTIIFKEPGNIRINRLVSFICTKLIITWPWD